MMAVLTPDEIAERIHQVRTTLPDGVRLIAVTKTFPAAVVRAAYGAGLRDFGENRVQEAIAKQAELSDLPDLCWHLIGHLQSNKARKAVAHFDWIHSVDSLKLAQRLDQLAAERGRSPQCCLQIKIVPDPDKSGFTLPELWQALPALSACQHLNLAGLMVIPPLDLSPSVTQSVFEQAHHLIEEIRDRSGGRLVLHHLSMGMSGDYPLAVAAGATMIRLGTALFGRRA